MFNGRKYILQLDNILHIPTNKNNLFSIGRWDKGVGECKIIDGTLQLYTRAGKPIAQGKHVHKNLYKLCVAVHERGEILAKRTETTYSTPEKLKSWETWHKRFGHVGYSGLQKLLSDNLVDGLNVDAQSPKLGCITCIEAKHTEDPFPKKQSWLTEPGELMHIDLWGKYEIESINGHQYYILFMDDAT